MKLLIGLLMLSVFVGCAGYDPVPFGTCAITYTVPQANSTLDFVEIRYEGKNYFTLNPKDPGAWLSVESEYPPSIEMGKKLTEAYECLLVHGHVEELE